MIKEAIDRVLDLAVPNLVTENGLRYSDKRLHLVSPPVVECLDVATLTGFHDLVEKRFECLLPDASIVQICSEREVRLIDKMSDQFGRRRCLIRAELGAEQKFRFGQWLAVEEFIIGLQACFVVNDAQKYLLELTSSITSDTVDLSEDDGISQRVTLKRGAALKTQEKVRARVILQPFRTFREIAQPGSEFLFRLRSGGDGHPPACALFEADGGAWKLDAVQAIKSWLGERITDIPVVA